MDARIDPAAVLGIVHGEAHVLRNAGAVVTEDVIRSLVISQRMLGTREVMVVAHTDCGMLTFRDGELKAEIQKDTGVRPHFAMEAFGDLDDEVRQSIARIRSCPFLLHKDVVRGFVYDVGDGRLREVD
jgi:carbonic anhydrase